MSKEGRPAWVLVAARVTKNQKERMKRAAQAKGMSLSQFLAQAGLAAAERELGPVVDGFDEPLSATILNRKGPGGFEGQGMALALKVDGLLARKYDEAEAKELRGLLKDALASGDRLEVWMWLERWLPETIRKVPERRQVSFLRAFMSAAKGSC